MWQVRSNQNEWIVRVLKRKYAAKARIAAIAMAIFFFQAEDGIRVLTVTGVQTCALPISIFPGTWTFNLRGGLRGAVVDAAQIERPRSGENRAAQRDLIAYLPPVLQGELAADDGAQIGRASCRERRASSLIGGPLDRRVN